MEVKQIETSGWLLKVGDVYSNPYEASHFKITKITIEEGAEPDDAFVHGDRVHPEDYEKRVHDPDVFETDEKHRAWYLNEQFSLETK